MTEAALAHAADRGDSPTALARATIGTHSKSFALASRLLDGSSRDATAIVYTFCRRADDAIDLGADPRAALTRLERELATIYDIVATRARAEAAPPDHDSRRVDDVSPGGNRSQVDDVPPGGDRSQVDDLLPCGGLDPVLAAFAQIAVERRIPRAYPAALLAGMAMDVAGTRYATLADLHAYCYRVAGVVGLMLCHVFGIRDDAALVPAARLGVAMQLTNICRDVAEDWARGRCYVPHELLAAHGAGGLGDDPGGIVPKSARAPLAGAIRDLLALADGHYRAADAGVAMLPWRAGLGVRAARSIYAAIGDVIVERGCDVTAPRAVVPTTTKLALVGAALGRSIAGLPATALRRLAGRPRLPMRTLELTDVPLA